MSVGKMWKQDGHKIIVKDVYVHTLLENDLWRLLQ